MHIRYRLWKTLRVIYGRYSFKHTKKLTWIATKRGKNDFYSQVHKHSGCHWLDSVIVIKPTLWSAGCLALIVNVMQAECYNSSWSVVIKFSRRFIKFIDAWKEFRWSMLRNSSQAWAKRWSSERRRWNEIVTLKRSILFYLHICVSLSIIKHHRHCPENPILSQHTITYCVLCWMPRLLLVLLKTRSLLLMMRHLSLPSLTFSSWDHTMTWWWPIFTRIILITHPMIPLRPDDFN